METNVADNSYSGLRRRFHRRGRLLQHDVVTLLHEGIRLTRADFLVKAKENRVGQGRIAIAVPKRILKSAVDRNRVKRVIREEFRHHHLYRLPVDILVTLRSKFFVLTGERNSHKHENQELRETLTKLLSEVTQRFGVVS